MINTVYQQQGHIDHLKAIQELDQALQDKTKTEEEKRAIMAQHEAERIKYEAEKERMRLESEQRRKVFHLLF